MEPHYTQTEANCAQRKAEDVARNVLALFSPQEIVIFVAYVSGTRLTTSDVVAARDALACGGATISPAAGSILMRLPALLGGPLLHQGGTLFLVAHATRSALSSPKMEKGELEELLKKATSHPDLADAWVTPDGLFRTITGKIGELVSWDSAQKLLSAGLSAVGSRLIGAGGRGVLPGMVISMLGEAVDSGGANKPAVAAGSARLGGGSTKILPAPGGTGAGTGLSKEADLTIVED